MKKTTLILMTIVIVCSPIVSPEASADNGRYSLTGPVVTFGGDGILRSMTMVPTSGRNPTVVDPGGGNFAVDSFFDVFTELDLPSGQQFRVESFFDVFTELSVDGGGSFPADSFFDVFVELDIKPDDSPGKFDTEIVSMSLSGTDNTEPVIRAHTGPRQPGGSTSATRLPDGNYHVDSFFDITYEIDFDGSGGTGGFIPGDGPALMRSFPDGVPTPREVRGKEYSHHLDINAPAIPDPMQNLAWDGTGNAWDTFDYSDAINHDWPQGTNVDAIANIQDNLFHKVVNDEVPLLVTIDDGAALVPVPGDYENIHYQTTGPASVAGIWAKGVIPGVPVGAPPTSDIHTTAVQIRHAADPNHVYRWLSPTGIEVWGPEVSEGDVAGGGAIGDDAIMFSTSGDWAWDPIGKKNMPQPAVWKYDPLNKLVFPYIMANQIRDAIDNSDLRLAERDIPVNVDGMMIYDEQMDDEFGPGDSIMFTIHTARDSTGAILLDGGEIWVWNFDDGPFGSAQFLTHGGITWDTLNSVIGVFPNVFAEENIGGLEAVPEPATMTLLALGGLAVLRRRRRSA